MFRQTEDSFFIKPEQGADTEQEEVDPANRTLFSVFNRHLIKEFVFKGDEEDQFSNKNECECGQDIAERFHESDGLSVVKGYNTGLTRNDCGLFPKLNFFKERYMSIITYTCI